ncbi:MAG: hypothetical protein FJ312_05670 [SAR202 cluster bacterium]|nr:hypothetical protein [SAR202 cluster bacterium]
MARPVQPPEPTSTPNAGQPAGSDPPTAGQELCDICGAVMLEDHCKMRCPACGYTRDCSDP